MTASRWLRHLCPEAALLEMDRTPAHRVSVPASTMPAMADDCSSCGKPAVCVYGINADERWACREHDPMAQPGFVTRTLPYGFQYRTLPAFAAPMAAPTLDTQIVITNDGGP